MAEALKNSPESVAFAGAYLVALVAMFAYLISSYRKG